MRQRRLRNLDQKYESYEDLIVYEPAKMRGVWDAFSGGRPLYIEIGCGKGKFISELAEREPNHCFVAIEGNKSVMLRAMEKIKRKGLTNVKFVPELAGDLSEWFSDGEVAGIYLNFSDPLPKNYWYKRRLTYRDRLKSYFKVLADNGVIVFKTDNTGLFEWTLLEIRAADLKVTDITRDLHADPERNAENIETEYEAKYSGLGEKIKRVVIGRRMKGFEGQAERKENMSDKSMAAYNGREIPMEDKVFATVARAKAAEESKGKDAVINATAGVLKDDDGNTVVLDAVMKTIRSLGSSDYVEYAPIQGIREYRDAVLKTICRGYAPKSYVKVIATPGGTGAVRLAAENYSCPADRILTHNYYWAPYETMAGELGRGFETFEMFDECGSFNLADFEYKVKKLTRNQEHMVVILNTPAANPTGYTLSESDWQGVKRVMDDVPLEKKIALVIDVAYMDYAGDDDETRIFLPIIDNLRSNIIPIIAYSASKTFTMYGSRCGAAVCFAHSPEAAEEFERVCSFTARNAWSNSPRPAMETVSRLVNNPDMFEMTDAERTVWRNTLKSRMDAFDEEAAKVGLSTLPHSSAFFVTIPFDEPEALGAKLEDKDVFLIVTKGGVRVTLASISEEKCRRLPSVIKAAMESL